MLVSLKFESLTNALVLVQLYTLLNLKLSYRVALFLHHVRLRWLAIKEPNPKIPTRTWTSLVKRLKHLFHKELCYGMSSHDVL